MKKVIKNNLLGFILGGIVFSTIAVYAVTYQAKDVKYKETTVEAALNDLYKDKYICRRATSLHTEECSKTNTEKYCSGAGYTTEGSKKTNIITYGNLKTSGLKSGDAFDCDVNNDGKFDSEKERFYYVTSNGNKAVLLYYHNVTAGSIENVSYVSYYSSARENWHGPSTVIQQLPTTSQWTNPKLIHQTTRTLTNETSTNTTNNSSKTLPLLFNYSEKTARLLTYQEAYTACGNPTKSSIGNFKVDNCVFLLENTDFATSLGGSSCYWFENPYSGDSTTAWVASGHETVSSASDITLAYVNGNCSARPIIEVLKSDIEI